ncbi:MAG: [LysW]-aminoadipate kinase [Phycisphaerales bacterium]|nr:[LysW]-aminoadipate kinase [Phycisphaerales bacterium]MCB9837555.1 [LysW]-aminoadipate kinase [Phycisphaera sp.]
MSTIVIKIGGGEGIEPTALCPEIAGLVREGHRVVVVHGGSHETNVLAEALGHPTRTITSPGGQQSRRTDRRTLEIFEMVYCGKVNKGMVESLRREGVDAVGLSGIDAGLWIGSRKEAIRAVEDGRTVIIRDDLSGRVERVDAAFLNLLMDAGRVVVLTPPAVTDEGVAINVDADRAAAATAAALGADELLLLSNVPGLLRDPADSGSLIESVERDDLEVARSAAKGRMKNKVLAAEEALSGGVGRVVIGLARGKGAIAQARTGRGTVFACGAVMS